MNAETFAHDYPHTDEEVAANRWMEITEERYDDLLGCVPPARRCGEAFAVGEAKNHMNDGRVVHLMCICVYGDYWAKPYPIDAFDEDKFHDEVVKQASGGE